MCMRWLNECWAPAVAETERVLGSNELEQLLFVDGLSGQVNAAFIKTARTYDTLVHIGPAGTTDLTQPIDRGIGNMLKQRFKSKIDDWLASDAECVRRWTSAPGKGGLSASELRVMTTRLAADAWDEVKAASATIVKCAEQSGALIGVGGVGIEKFKLPQRGAGLDDAPLAVDSGTTSATSLPIAATTRRTTTTTPMTTMMSVQRHHRRCAPTTKTMTTTTTTTTCMTRTMNRATTTS